MVRVLSLILVSEGHQCVVECRVAEALRRIQEEAFCVVLVDGFLGGDNGCDLIRELRAKGEETFIIGMSAVFPEEDFMRAGADCFFEKPFEMQALLEQIEKECT